MFESRRERGDGLGQELHAKRSFPGRRGTEEVFVEHEHRDDIAALFRRGRNCGMQRLVIRRAQILASKPD
jgi:hypothetical protein